MWDQIAQDGRNYHEHDQAKNVHSHVGRRRAAGHGFRDRAANHRDARLAGGHHHDRWPLPAAAAGAVPGPDQPERHAVKARMARARGAAEGRAERPADPARRRGLRLEFDLRRRHSDAHARQDRRQRSALHQLPLNVAVLADACGAADRAQSPFGRLRRDLGDGDGLPRLRQRDGAGKRHRCQDPEGERLPHRLVRQEPQYAGVRDQPGRPVHSVADRHGFR